VVAVKTIVYISLEVEHDADVTSHDLIKRVGQVAHSAFDGVIFDGDGALYTGEGTVVRGISLGSLDVILNKRPS
jgi:hypothetical protein